MNTRLCRINPRSSTGSAALASILMKKNIPATPTAINAGPNVRGSEESPRRNVTRQTPQTIDARPIECRLNGLFPLQTAEGENGQTKVHQTGDTYGGEYSSPPKMMSESSSKYGAERLP